MSDAKPDSAVNPIMVTRTFVDADRGRARHHLIWCPGCDELHAPTSSIGEPFTGPVWEWDVNEAAPTFAPSLLVHLGPDRACHSFIRAGRWEFLSDCWHHLAGQTVPMVPVPDWLMPD